VAADSQDRPVGMVSLSHRPQLRLRGRIATVDEQVVTESWRRRFLGKALMEQVLDRCGERALSVKRLEVSAYALEELASFFEARGFVRVDNLVMRYEKLEGQHR
jgi:GNAT superfamily N-acetyltransferase